MRNEQKYFKLLQSWAKELSIAGKLLRTGCHEITAVLFGERRVMGEFLKRWKTQNVDIDSHGRPCKEKMLTVLCQQPANAGIEIKLGSQQFAVAIYKL